MVVELVLKVVCCADETFPLEHYILNLYDLKGQKEYGI